MNNSPTSQTGPLGSIDLIRVSWASSPCAKLRQELEPKNIWTETIGSGEPNKSSGSVVTFCGTWPTRKVYYVAGHPSLGQHDRAFIMIVVINSFRIDAWMLQTQHHQKPYTVVTIKGTFAIPKFLQNCHKWRTIPMNWPNKPRSKNNAAISPEPAPNLSHGVGCMVNVAWFHAFMNHYHNWGWDEFETFASLSIWSLNSNSSPNIFPMIIWPWNLVCRVVL